MDKILELRLKWLSDSMDILSAQFTVVCAGRTNRGQIQANFSDAKREENRTLMLDNYLRI